MKITQIIIIFSKTYIEKKTSTHSLRRFFNIDEIIYFLK